VCGEIGKAAILGFAGTSPKLAKDKVFVTLKHMTGHGQPENGTNTGPAEVTERTLREEFFPPFERAIKESNVGAVMPSYNEIGGVPSHANHWLLTKVLREEWGFKGLTVSDYMAVIELVSRHKLVDSAKEAGYRAFKAGVDIETPDGAGFKALGQLVKEGRISVSEIDAVVRRVLTMKFEAGLFENPYVDANAAESLTATKDAVALARLAATRTPVLLKNDKGLLPLDGKKVGKVLLIGTHAKDTPIGGYSDIPRHVVSIHGTGFLACVLGRRAHYRKPYLGQGRNQVHRSGGQCEADRRCGGSGQVGRHHHHGPGRQRANQPRGLGRHPPGRPRDAGHAGPAE
jgi:beta-glucosidase